MPAAAAAAEGTRLGTDPAGVALAGWMASRWIWLRVGWDSVLGFWLEET